MKRAANVTGIEAKIQRASSTLDALSRAVQEHLAQHCRVEGKLLAEQRRFAFYAYGPSSLPLHFAVVAGEVVHHLRSSLDHLVTELAALGPGGGKANRLEFPICSSEQLFEEACKRGKIKGVSANAAQLIKKLQPYHWDPPELSTLMVLNNLDVIDKHRTPLIAAVAPQMTSSITIDPNGQDVAIVGMTPPTSAGMRPSPDGNEIFSIQFQETYPRAPEITGIFPFRAMLDGGTVELPHDLPLIEVLTQCRDQVANVVGAFFMPAADGTLVERDPVASVTVGSALVV